MASFGETEAKGVDGEVGADVAINACGALGTVGGGAVEGFDPRADARFRLTFGAGFEDVAVAPVFFRGAEDFVGEAGVLETVGADERGLRVEGIKQCG